ncbi:MAG: DUF2953 domain-containing protein [Oscillospiraceae bacterium]|nr:DUF2953 domain-containing protein [Oscillospiraceae bacterium]MDD4413882.1 DUF2953 domain-containing protein [Oscillospiraceae bacterium]
MNGLLITLIILAILILPLLIPVYFSACFDGELGVRVRIMFISFKLYPRPLKSEKKQIKKEKKKTKKQEKKKEQLSRSEELLREEGIWAVVSYYTEIVRLIGTAVKRFIRIIVVDRLVLNIVVASDDASKTALDFGQVCAVIYPAQALIESFLKIRKRKITIVPDFMREKGYVRGEIKLHILPVRAIWVLILFFISYLGNTTKTQTANKKTENNN